MYKASHSACQGAYRRLVRDASGPRRLLHGIKLGRRRQPPDLHDRLKVHSHERSLRQQSNPSELQVQPMNAACQRAHADIMSMTSNLPRATPLLACLVRSQSWPTASERRPLSRKPRLSQGGSTPYSAHLLVRKHHVFDSNCCQSFALCCVVLRASASFRNE